MSANEPVYLTHDGVANLRRELEHLVGEKRPALAERLRRAIQQGDLSENADYITAKEEQGFLEGRIQQIEAMLRRSVIIEAGDTDVVGLGCRVTVEEDGAGEKEVFFIVGPVEADPVGGKISNESPIGSALMGRRVGEDVAVSTPGGELVFHVVAIE
jgi:transcription elongation factor GreA